VREDYNFQDSEYPNVDVPVGFLDNFFENPDLQRYLDVFEEVDPSVAVIGDAYSKEHASILDDVVTELEEKHSHKEYIVVPKCSEAFEELSESVTLGYPIGFSDLEPEDFSDLSDWRGRRVHLLGSSPEKQYSAMQKLTRPVLNDDPPADIAGADWNGMFKAAHFGEYWSRDGYKEADHLSIRETVRKSLEEIKEFWQEKDLWPETEPIDIYGKPTEEPDDAIWMDDGGDPISSLEGLEEAYVTEYEEMGKIAFQNQPHKKFIEYREDLTQV